MDTFTRIYSRAIAFVLAIEDTNQTDNNVVISHVFLVVFVTFCQMASFREDNENILNCMQFLRFLL